MILSDSIPKTKHETSFPTIYNGISTNGIVEEIFYLRLFLQILFIVNKDSVIFLDTQSVKMTEMADLDRLKTPEINR